MYIKYDKPYVIHIKKYLQAGKEKKKL